MRILLDSNISPRRIAVPLRTGGHDVLAAREERHLQDSADELLFELATAEGRIMVTFDVKDFSRLLHEWAEAGRSYAGCIIFVSLRNDEYGAILRRLEGDFRQRPEQAMWKDLALYR